MIQDYADLWAYSETTGTATASVGFAAGVTGHRNFVTSVFASFNKTAVGTLRLRSGTADIAVFKVHNQREVLFNPPLRFPPETAAGAVFDLGDSGALTQLLLVGFGR